MRRVPVGVYSVEKSKESLSFHEKRCHYVLTLSATNAAYCSDTSIHVRLITKSDRDVIFNKPSSASFGLIPATSINSDFFRCST
jgi:hypothetical protein